MSLFTPSTHERNRSQLLVENRKPSTCVPHLMSKSLPVTTSITKRFFPFSHHLPSVPQHERVSSQTYGLCQHRPQTQLACCPFRIFLQKRPTPPQSAIERSVVPSPERLHKPFLLLLSLKRIGKLSVHCLRKPSLLHFMCYAR